MVNVWNLRHFACYRKNKNTICVYQDYCEDRRNQYSIFCDGMYETKSITWITQNKTIKPIQNYPRKEILVKNVRQNSLFEQLQK